MDLNKTQPSQKRNQISLPSKMPVMKRLRHRKIITLLQGHRSGLHKTNSLSFSFLLCMYVPVGSLCKTLTVFSLIPPYRPSITRKLFIPKQW